MLLVLLKRSSDKATFVLSVTEQVQMLRVVENFKHRHEIWTACNGSVDKYEPSEDYRH